MSNQKPSRIGRRQFLYGAGAGATLLHAESVRFRHPVSGETILIEAPPPDWAKIRA